MFNILIFGGATQRIGFCLAQLKAQTGGDAASSKNLRATENNKNLAGLQQLWKNCSTADRHQR